jgi:hypothetical protein
MMSSYKSMSVSLSGIDDNVLRGKLKHKLAEQEGLEIIRSTCGVTRKVDRITNLFTTFRQACQKEFEAFACSEMKKLPADEIFDCAAGLSAPRTVWGVEWKRMCLAIANRYERFALLDIMSAFSRLLVPFYKYFYFAVLFPQCGWTNFARQRGGTAR